MRFLAIAAALAFCASCAGPAEPQPLFINTASDNAALDVGLARVQAGDEAGAIPHFTQAIAADPKSAAAHRWREDGAREREDPERHHPPPRHRLRG